MAKCKGCEKEIQFGKTSDGKTIPLDIIAPVYRLMNTDPNTGDPIVERVMNCYASHAGTCPEANRFSRKNSPVNGK